MRKLALPTLLLMASSAQGNDALYTAQFSTCMDRSGGLTYAMLNCIGEELDNQDARLNDFGSLSGN